MTSSGKLHRACGRESNPVFIAFDLFWYTDYHIDCLILVGEEWRRNIGTGIIGRKGSKELVNPDALASRAHSEERNSTL
jgi:hypothetical protein